MVKVGPWSYPGADFFSRNGIIKLCFLDTGFRRYGFSGHAASDSFDFYRD